MSAAGPELPPHLLAKRKRQQEEDEIDEGTTAPGAKRARSPSGPARQVGPAPPPAPLDERPAHPPEDDGESESSDDDDFGPSLPTSADQSTSKAVASPAAATGPSPSVTKSPPAGSKRDDWMTMPPTQDDLAARLDPSKPRARGFNTGKGAKGPSGGGSDNSAWTETPEQKRQRLANQVMGVKAAPSGRDEASDVREKARREEDSARAASIKTSRGQSLYDMHQKKKGREEDDDPSQRAFDREKDMGVGVAVSGKQRRELLNNAAGFSSKFSSGSFL